MLAVLGSIFAGVASPTEAASVGAVGATVLTVMYKKFNYVVFMDVMKQTMSLTCMVFIILIGATTLGLVFRGLDGDRLVRGLITSLPFGKWGILFIVMGIIFIAGFFLDFIEITFIHVPVLAPIMVSMGVNPLWLAVLIAVNLQTSFLTPPFGFSLFYLKGVTPPEVSTMDIYKGIIPFVIIQIIGLLIISAICGLPFLSPILGPGAVIAQVIGVAIIGPQIANGTISPAMALPALFAYNTQVGCDFVPVGLALGEAKPKTIEIGVPAVLISRQIMGPVSVALAWAVSLVVL